MFNAARHTMANWKEASHWKQWKLEENAMNFLNNCQPGILYQVKIFQNQRQNYGIFGHKHESPQEDQCY